MAAASTSLLPMPNDPVIAALTNGTHWQLSPDRVITWAIADSYSFMFANPIAFRNSVAIALGAIEQFVNVDFVYTGYYADVSYSPADLTYTVLDFPHSTHWFQPTGMGFANFPYKPWSADFATRYAGSPAYYPYSEGDVFLNGPNLQGGYASFLDGTAGKFLLIHETGHALGLKHPHDDGGTGRPTFAQIGLSLNDRIEFSYGDGYDVDAFTSMSYNDDLAWNTWSGDPATFMPLDVIALQWLYGANPTTNAGDTIHLLSQDGAYRTIWDASGIDTLDASQSNYGWIISLTTPTSSALLAPHMQRLAIAVPILPSGVVDETTLTWIFDAERAVGSFQDDLIIGNDGPNFLLGNPGDDIVVGAGGDDFVAGHFGEDVLIGGFGSDFLLGGIGADTFLLFTATESSLAGWDLIGDLELFDQVKFDGIGGVALRGGAYPYLSNVSATVTSISNEASILDQVVFFSNGANGFLYVKGAGNGNSFDGALIELSGITSPPHLFQLPNVGTQNLLFSPFSYLGGEVTVTLVANSVDGQPDPNPSGIATLSNVEQQAAPHNPPAALHLPIGLISFEATVSQPGKTESFSLSVDSLVPVDGFWKQDTQGQWVNLASTVVHSNGQTRVDFTLTDGGEFDGDGTANGVIVDPGGMGWADRPVLSLADKVLALYVAYFGRAPDAQGFQFWQNVAQSGLSLYDISAGFANHPRFAQEYGGLTNAQIAAKIYLNVLHRPGDANGIVFWENQLNSRPASQIFVDFAIGALEVDLEGMYSRGELTAEEYAVAFERQKISENLMQASRHFLDLFGDATSPTAPPDQVANDPAYQASIAVLKNVDSDLNLVFDQRDDLIPLVGLPDAMQQIVDLFG